MNKRLLNNPLLTPPCHCRLPYPLPSLRSGHYLQESPVKAPLGPVLINRWPTEGGGAMGPLVCVWGGEGREQGEIASSPLMLPTPRQPRLPKVDCLRVTVCVMLPLPPWSSLPSSCLSLPSPNSLHSLPLALNLSFSSCLASSFLPSPSFLVIYLSLLLASCLPVLLTSCFPSLPSCTSFFSSYTPFLPLYLNIFFLLAFILHSPLTSISLFITFILLLIYP